MFIVIIKGKSILGSSFGSMKRLGIGTSLPGWSASTLQITPSVFRPNNLYCQYTFVLLDTERHFESDVFLPRNNIMTPVSVCAQTCWSDPSPFCHPLVDIHLHDLDLTDLT